MNFKEIVKMIEDDGWYLTGIRGSHHYFKHPLKAGKVTIPKSKKSDLNKKTVESIKKQAGLK